MAGKPPSNPWAETDLLTGIKLGCPENGLVMARQFSLERVGLPPKCARSENLCIADFVSAFHPCPCPSHANARTRAALQSALPRSGSVVANYPMSRYLEAVRKASDLRCALNEVLCCMQ